MVKKYLLVLTLLFVWVAPAWADFAAGKAAYARSDYKNAFREFKTEANRGHARAQFALGFMYYNGQGITRNYAEAAKWYRKAAEHGIADAQSSLGVMYANGRGITRNYAEAAKWYRKSAEHSDSDGQNGL